MNNILIRSVIILVVTAAAAAVANLINPNAIEWVGHWPDPTESDTIWLSPSYMPEEDPSTIALGTAFERFLSEEYVFVDAREPEDYELGHIKGAISLPFDSFDDYWEQAQPQMPVDTPVVIYCSGSECESSLNLARYMVEELGYQREKVELFFGGWRAWYNNRLPIDGDYGTDDDAFE
jgi:rhodanese-related sulfurtransferase